MSCHGLKMETHDRVFTAMLQHTLSLTDDSRYLRENFTDKKELVFYSLEKREELPELVKKLLEKPEKCNGNRRAGI